jgi:hypothetical protein
VWEKRPGGAWEKRAVAMDGRRNEQQKARGRNAPSPWQKKRTTEDVQARAAL